MMATAPREVPYTKAFERALIRAVDGWRRWFILEMLAEGSITREEALEQLRLNGLLDAGDGT